ncbi:predicted protein [Aspergillus terreus NIH2624]|uniref:Uncharacterized protein n=1 Tax=Aspergillus terreus (strain NIH 2624 / FGSC A1156) TaxID=341663 RepID=Q0CI90_ASPTN|nr:uncharacterized protein ATEG_06594 [Aspergillus terreus NIH2624]EAU33138.1 predicted protein [Aspergillus terreus NIH2624]
MPLPARMHVHHAYEASCQFSPVTSTMDNLSYNRRPSMAYEPEPDHYFAGRPSREIRANKIYTQTYILLQLHLCEVKQRCRLIKVGLFFLNTSSTATNSARRR